MEENLETNNAVSEPEQSAPTLTVEQQKARKRKATKELRTAAESAEQVKKKRGDWRPNSGRKPNYLKRMRVPALEAHAILSYIDEPKIWIRSGN